MCKKAISMTVLPYTCTTGQMNIGYTKVYTCSALSIAIRESSVREDTLAVSLVTPNGPVVTGVNCSHSHRKTFFSSGMQGPNVGAISVAVFSL